MFFHGFEEPDGCGDVVVIYFEGFACGAADVGVGGDVVDAVGSFEEGLPAVFEEVGVFECGEGADVVFEVCHAACDHGVDDGDGVAAGEEVVYEVGADESCSAGYDTVHVMCIGVAV